jgi:Lar family restriction alleviation protein
MTEQLLPCPFCGGNATRQDIDYDTMGAEPADQNYGGSFIECDDCGACSHVEFGFKENLVSRWNRRTDVRAGIDLEDA